jgi:hypothetical protein
MDTFLVYHISRFKLTFHKNCHFYLSDFTADKFWRGWDVIRCSSMWHKSLLLRCTLSCCILLCLVLDMEWFGWPKLTLQIFNHGRECEYLIIQDMMRILSQNRDYFSVKEISLRYLYNMIILSPLKLSNFFYLFICIILYIHVYRYANKLL